MISPQANMSQPKSPPVGSAWWAMIRGRCPRCRQGKIFCGSFAMNEVCPVCKLRFQRDQGYFLGAMYVSYPIAVVLILMGLAVGCWLLPDWDMNAVLLLIVIPCYLPFVPAVFRYSRIGWIYFDRVLCGSSDMVDSQGWEQWCKIWEEQDKAK
jgi:uncharacterized protein (DUF983 family)